MTVSAGIEPVEIAGSGLVTKWFSVRAVERQPVHETVDGADRVTDGGNGPLTLVASTEQEDRAGDVVRAAGWELEAYRANPVFLWAHDYRRPAIGKCTRVWVQDAGEGGRLMASIEFAPTPFAQEIRSLYATGFMRGVSVGFRAIEIEPRTGDSGRRGVLFKRQELLEISAAPVPVNPGALVRHGAAEPEITDMGLRETRISDRANPPELHSAKHEIREFWQVLAGLSGDEIVESEVEVEGATRS